ncbi:gliding motility-associated C-terminal domain-containing protein [Marivirga lumbricoides]|uniref:T9SS type B sorting domain-containing protein n=1 Tax=Marivirga lumbricoides TaxID=1046115 RepID=UPI00166CE6AB
MFTFFLSQGHAINPSHSTHFNSSSAHQNIDVFEILPGTTTVEVQKGFSGTVNITINRAAEFTDAVSLSIHPLPGLPANVSANYAPASVPGTANSSVLTLQVTESASTGSYPLKIAGTANYEGITRYRLAEITLIIKEVEAPGTVGSFTFLENDEAISGYSAINSNITVGQEDLPEIINFRASINGAATAVKWNFKEQGSGSTIQSFTDESSPYTLYPSGGWTVTPGVFELEAVQINNTVEGTAKKIIITVEEAPPVSFTLKANPYSLSVFRGESTFSIVSLTPVNNFSGSATLSLSGLPAGVTAEMSRETISSNTTESTATIDFFVADNTSLGSYSIVVTGNGPAGLTASTTIDLTITQDGFPDFELNVARQSISLIQGESTQINIVVESIDGFSEPVALEVSTSRSDFTISVDPPLLENGAGQSSLKISSEPTTSLGNFEIQLFASSGAIEKSAVISIKIEPIPIEVKPRNQFSPNGDGIDDVWKIEKIEELPDNSVEVFDRLGQEVYSAQPYNNDWNGTSKNGEQLAPTTYFYVVKDAGGKTVKTGSINLLR